ncbi:hypothetical protein AU15_22060 [Marinobacter salarius]|uniref:Uncharacterized protein n=1 Tax=Marinobacter salarius TaxID=1420917 RepID=W5YWJ2_9GAMM|nr:hypothetical protein AU15_22060 [Marinobacter salarius]
MPLIVLNEEMTISDHGEDKLGHPTVKRFFFMAEFVACVQSQAIYDPQGKGQCQKLENIHWLRGYPPGTDNQGRIMNRNS